MKKLFLLYDTRSEISLHVKKISPTLFNKSRKTYSLLYNTIAMTIEVKNDEIIKKKLSDLMTSEHRKSILIMIKVKAILIARHI